MSASDRFALDANVFIQAHKTYYAFDICPGFWAALIRQFRFGALCSIDRIESELVGEGDQLANWVKKTIPKEFFKGTADQEVIESFGEMMNWVQGTDQFTPEAKAAFASAADGWLVAFARVNDPAVVTHEQYAPQAKTDVKIPNICVEFDVEYCDTFEMIRRVKEQFVLKTRRRRG